MSGFDFGTFQDAPEEKQALPVPLPAAGHVVPIRKPTDAELDDVFSGLSKVHIGKPPKLVDSGPTAVDRANVRV